MDGKTDTIRTVVSEAGLSPLDERPSCSGSRLSCHPAPARRFSMEACMFRAILSLCFRDHQVRRARAKNTACEAPLPANHLGNGWLGRAGSKTSLSRDSGVSLYYARYRPNRRPLKDGGQMAVSSKRLVLAGWLAG
ncbi:hypothetical protein M406DRAFT_104765 [Cryphonectria parasitica EP155]|uniref:Uncharacterized protein n=1 Tax=Cryphonectria parasitica (strain ATCC 38755 / EP155) TaxID=660469 RepID=A0A9P4XUM2_CRYP1|nr:uncharacterized protein M406DRAFT_104765 [Cryphonectria parasitica EP155]KAF3761293.1 hypothetical protein M406DRAFT_104765 [Cryphonectria parasitica EP155]